MSWFLCTFPLSNLTQQVLMRSLHVDAEGGTEVRSICMACAKAIATVFVLWSSSAWGVTLLWDASTDANLAGYRVYQCSQLPCTKTSGKASLLATLGKVTSFNLGTPAVTTYYFVTANDLANNESAESNFATFTPSQGGGATISANSTSVQPGASVSVTVSNGPGNTTDWIGLYPSTAPNDAPSLLTWKYLNDAQTPPASGKTAATLTFSMPSTAGTYQFRFFSNGYNLLATSANVVSSATGSAAPGGATISANSTSVKPGALVSVTVSNGPGNTKDWVGLFSSTAPNDYRVLLAWKYLNDAQIPPTSGKTAATLTLSMPPTAGTYQFRLFSNNGYNLLATSANVVSK